MIDQAHIARDMNNLTETVKNQSKILSELQAKVSALEMLLFRNPSIKECGEELKRLADILQNYSEKVLK